MKKVIWTIVILAVAAVAFYFGYWQPKQAAEVVVEEVVCCDSTDCAACDSTKCEACDSTCCKAE